MTEELENSKDNIFKDFIINLFDIIKNYEFKKTNLPINEKKQLEELISNIEKNI